VQAYVAEIAAQAPLHRLMQRGRQAFTSTARGERLQGAADEWRLRRPHPAQYLHGGWFSRLLRLRFQAAKNAQQRPLLLKHALDRLTASCLAWFRLGLARWKEREHGLGGADL